MQICVYVYYRTSPPLVHLHLKGLETTGPLYLYTTVDY
jgi:hypothetical protein